MTNKIMLVRLKKSILLLSFVFFTIASIAQNAVVTENALTGNPSSEWDVSGAGDLSIQGFATDISVNRGNTIHFKINTDANAYTIDIYRLGYYQGNGARKVGTGTITATLPQLQPAELYDPSTGLTDCGNWNESAHWDVPANAVSGLYIAKLTRTDNSGASHIVFVVRDDASTSNLYFQTSDATWQAYNVYGGNSLYTGSTSYTSGHAAKVSYNRPFVTRNGGGGGGAEEDWLFNAEYPMIRWLERNGYDVSYTTDMDADRNGALILNHKVFMSVGHDEYWSAQQRANVEAARNAGVHLAFFSGNEIYWKTRWENSTDGSNTPYRTLVCYKEGTSGENVCGGKCDPLPNTWTGLWREGCEYPSQDGCKPENALSGQISWDGTSGAIEVPDTYKNLRFWRNTPVASLASGQTMTLTDGTLGYEWDWNQYKASFPAGRIQLSSTVLNTHEHNLSLYKHASGALVFGAGTVQWSWGLDGNHDRGGSIEDQNIQQATVNLFADMGVQPGTLQAGLVPTTASTDFTAPVSIITSPSDGTMLPNGSSVTISGTASDNAVVAGVEISTDGGASWFAANGTTSWSYSWIPTTQGPITIKSRAIDDSGNLEAEGTSPSPNVITGTVSAPLPVVCPCTVFQPTDIPAIALTNDNQAIELGSKFQVTQNGYITGIRYYKGAGTTGLHRGHIWNNTTLLSEVTFTNETSSGWQEASFPTPIPVVAGTTYLASYHSASGDYAYTDSYFASAVVKGPIRFLADGEDGANGVYRYTSEPAYPSDNYQSSNYWVDVVFNDSIGPDTIPPFVTAISPIANSTGVNVHTTLCATFSQAIDVSTLSNSSFVLLDPANNPVAATISYNSATRTAILAPTSALTYTTTYSVTVKGGTGYNRIKDLAGNAMVKDCTWVFTTSTAPAPTIPPTEGSGGPILVISSTSNPFSRYNVEILRAEGLNEFSAMDITQVNAAILNNYDVIILGEFPLAASDVAMLTSWVNAGGTLIAMRPDAQLSSLLGITPTGSSMMDKYLLVNNSGPGTGIVNQTIQYHSNADLYNLNGAAALATLYSNATTATTYPAVTTHSVGSNGGQAIAFTYDLARSVVYTRQGNPAWAGQKRDGQINPIRSDDQFYPDWIDMNKVAIPQADEQQHLLSNIIIKSNLHKKPLPKFWFLPKGLKAAVVMTGDDHGDAGMQPRFDVNILESTAGCSVDDWDCIRSTGYLYVGSTFTDAMAKHYDSLGFEIALHVNTNCDNFSQSEYENYITSQFATFGSAFPNVPLPKTNRNHCIAWSDWSTTAEVEAAQGIRFDVNYYYWPGPWVNNQPGMFTGSGMPMRFAKIDGTIIDCYQAVTQMPDESNEIFPQFCDALLDKAVGPEGYYGVFTTNMHFDNPNHPGANDIVASAKSHHIPVVTAKQMLDWIDGRNNSSFDTIYWHTDTLNFVISAAAGSRNMQAMVPTASASGNLTAILFNGSSATYTVQTIKGIEYAFIYSPTGSYTAIYGDTTTQLHITALSAIPNSGTSANVTWTTDKAADSKIYYGTSASSLNLSASNNVLVTSHAIPVSGLTPGTTYYYRVTSKDASNDSATAPDLALPPKNFTTPNSPCAQDQVAADFNLGAPDANTTISLSTDGEVILKPAFIDEFAGTTLSGNWTAGNWNSGGVQTVNGGSLTVDGGFAATSTVFSPKQSLEFVADFQSATFQNVGFSADANFNAPWITIGQGNTAGSLYARSDQGTNILLGAGLAGTAHKYRIEWNTSSFVFYVDGVLTATINQTISSNMVAIVSDFNAGGGMIQLDWMRVTPYSKTGSFTSRIFDYGDTTSWSNITWNAVTPVGTNIGLFVRTGNTSTPDTTWTGFSPMANGASVSAASQYIQYRADLSTTDSTLTPELKDISIGCGSSTVCVPPTATISATNSSACFGSNINLQLDGGSGQAPYKLVVNGTTYTNVAVGQNFATIKPSENSIWGNTGLPANANGNDGLPIETGTKFRAAVNGYVSGIRFYKGLTNTGTHIASLWSANGIRLATTPFTSESASGWQEVHFSTPVYIKADTTYIASYFSPGGTFAITPAYFTNSGVTTPPLTALQKGIDGPNGVYKYGGGFPDGGNDANYWVDVLFMPEQTMSQVMSYTLTSITDNANCANTGTLSIATVTVNPLPNGTIVPAGSLCKGSPIELAFNATSGTGPFTIKVNDSTYSNIFSGIPFSTGINNNGADKSIWSNSTLPGTASVVIDSASIELGVKFRSTAAGKINGIRFYKGSANTGTHTGSLWSSTGSLLATATFTSETSSGWQQVVFSTPVTITANTTYIASYFAPNGRYAFDKDYFAASGAVNTPLKALQNGEDGSNGVYIYSSGGVFPNNSFSASNYWVDVLFSAADSGRFILSQISDVNNCGQSNGNTIHVTQNPTYAISLTQSICNGDSILIGNQYKKMAGVYYDSLNTVKGCDSIRIITLNIRPIDTQTTVASLCSGSNYTFPDGTVQNNITANVLHVNHFQKINGCDSLVTTMINIKPSYSINKSVFVCSGGSYTFPDGATQNNLTSVSTHTSNLQTSTGCDSIIVTTVNINPVYSQTATVSVCTGSSYTFPDGSIQNNITSVASHTSILQSMAGCDSIVETIVNIRPTYTQTVSASICNHGNYTFPDGVVQNNITSTTVHTSSLQTQTGCDSIIITTVQVIPLFNLTESIALCSGSNYIFPDGFVQNNITGDITHICNLQSSLGCDSTIIITVYVSAKPNVMANATQTVVCMGAGVTLTGIGATTYTWSNGVVDGVEFTPSAGQTYTVSGTDLNNCTNSATIAVNVNPLPIVTFSTLGFPDTVCINAGQRTLTGGSPSGGIYSGSGVNGILFDPFVAGSGVHIITYSYTDVNLCANSETHNVKVDSCLVTGIANQSNTNGHLLIYPNPGNGNFTVSSSDRLGLIRIYNSIGELVLEMQTDTSTQEIDISNMRAGVYTLEIQKKHVRIIKE